MGDHWMTVSVYFVGRLSAEDVVVPGATAPPPPGGAAQAASAAGGGRGGRGRGAGRGGRGRGAGRGPSAAAAAAPPAPAAPVPLTVTVASLDAQRVIHGVLEEAGSVFDTGAGLSCFTTITEVTFAVHSRRGVVIISLQGRQQVEDFLDERARAAQRGRNLIWLADFIRSQVFGNQNPVSCVEVEQGLLRMLSQGDFSLWPLIRNHSSLVPLCNRPILVQRLYEELVTVVVTTDMRGYKRILGALDIPYGQQHGWKQWHEDVLSPTSTNSRFLKVFYAASSYNRWNPMREVQAFQLLRFHRNPSIHGLEHAVPAGGVDASTELN